MAWEYLKFFHIAFAFMLVAGVALAEYGAARGRKTTNPGLFEAYLRTAAQGGMMAGAGTVILSIFGVLTAWQQGLSLTDTGWLNAAYLIVIVATIVPPLTLGRWGSKAGKLMPQAYERGEVLPEQVRLIGGPAYKITSWLVDLLIVGALVLMVFKPF